MYPLLANLAKQTSVLGFQHRLSEARETELKNAAFDDHTPLHGLGKSFVRKLDFNVQFQVKTSIGGKNLMLGYFPGERVVNAFRFADMATIFFAKYKTNRGTSLSYLQANRGNLKHIFNCTEAEAFLDMERETRLVTHLKDIEMAAQQLGFLTTKVTKVDTVTMMQRLTALESTVKQQGELLNQFITKSENWREAVFQEIWKLKPLQS